MHVVRSVESGARYAAIPSSLVGRSCTGVVTASWMITATLTFVSPRPSWRQATWKALSTMGGVAIATSADSLTTTSDVPAFASRNNPCSSRRARNSRNEASAPRHSSASAWPRWRAGVPCGHWPRKIDLPLDLAPRGGRYASARTKHAVSPTTAQRFRDATGCSVTRRIQRRLSNQLRRDWPTTAASAAWDAPPSRCSATARPASRYPSPPHSPVSRRLARLVARRDAGKRRGLPRVTLRESAPGELRGRGGAGANLEATTATTRYMHHHDAAGTAAVTVRLRRARSSP